MSGEDKQLLIKEKLHATIMKESNRFEEYYLWLEQAMPPLFFEEISHDNIMLIVHNLMGMHLQDCFSVIHLKRAAIVILLDSPDADLRVLKNYSFYGIKNYQAFISRDHFPGTESSVRIAMLHFTEASIEPAIEYPRELLDKLKAFCKERNPEITEEEFDSLLGHINSRFLRSLSFNRLILALDMFFRAKTRDSCQYEVRYNDDWETTGAPSMQIVFAWKNCPKHNFLYQIARCVARHKLVMKRVVATDIDPYSQSNILVMAIGLNGINGKAAWDVAEVPDFLRELVTIKFFDTFDKIDEFLVTPGVIGGIYGNLLRAIFDFVHQGLVHVDSNLYTPENIEEAFLRHPELTVALCQAFKFKFDPHHVDLQAYEETRTEFLRSLKNLDTGHEENDQRRRHVLMQAMNFVHYTLKTNFYRLNFTGFSFRLDPLYLDELPFDRKKLFPELPYAIFYIKGMDFFGYHIRFKDLSRGGLRTVTPRQPEEARQERKAVFLECYNLAYTQHFKNKDIPEGGAKGIIFLQPSPLLESEAQVLKMELQDAKIQEEEIQQRVDRFLKEQREESLYQAQRSYIESLITIVNCDPDGRIRAKFIVDYWKRPEYLYLGPDENMHDSMIEWIAEASKKYGYKPGSAFISGKPRIGINHKEYGVTSLGVNVYMEKALAYLGIDPHTTPFTLKISGGPDGDVAGNQIKNLYRLYPKTAKLIALIDVSGTIYDPEGLDLEILNLLFKEGRPIRYYPPEKLHSDGFLLDKSGKKGEAYAQKTLLWRKKDNSLQQEWLLASDMNHILKTTINETPADIFIPAGGRPRTLNENNIEDFLDATGRPTARAIIEGANLYLTEDARLVLEDKGCLIFKDSSANKTGVICSSFEVLSGLTLGDELFVQEKESLVNEILERLKVLAAKEADLLLKAHSETGVAMSLLSYEISKKINTFTYELLDHLETIELPKDPEDPLMQCFFDYCLPTLRDKYKKRLMEEIPDVHKKAVIAAHIGSNVVYNKGLDWAPSIVYILPLLLKEPK